MVKWKLHSHSLINRQVNIVVGLKDTHNECQYLTLIFANWTKCFKTNLRTYFRIDFSNTQVDAYTLLQLTHQGCSFPSASPSVIHNQMCEHSHDHTHTSSALHLHSKTYILPFPLHMPHWDNRPKCCLHVKVVGMDVWAHLIIWQWIIMRRHSEWSMRSTVQIFYFKN